MPEGPCLCGDPGCPHCGNPEAARVEAAEEWALDQLAAAKLHADEYRTVVRVGLAAVKQQRKAVNAALKEDRMWRENE